MDTDHLTAMLSSASPAFVSPERPARYTAVTMREHMDTTVRNLEAGRGGWDERAQASTTASYAYGTDGRDPPQPGGDDALDEIITLNKKRPLRLRVPTGTQ